MEKYKIIKKIPLSTLKIGDIIEINGNNITFNGMNVPFDSTSIIKEYAERLNRYKQKYAIGERVVFIDGSSVSKIAFVISFNELTNNYLLKFANKQEITLHDCHIKKYEEYYFVNSKGIKQKEVLHRDQQADEWRKKIGNFFTDSTECEKYRLSLIK